MVSAEQGNVYAQHGLGLLYLNCLGNRAEGIRLLALAGKQGDVDACYQLAKALSQPGGQGSDKVAAYIWFCLAEAYHFGEAPWKVCEKEIQKLESELSVDQILAAQLRIKDEFQPLVVLAARAEAEAQRVAAEDEMRRVSRGSCIQRLEQTCSAAPRFRDVVGEALRELALPPYDGDTLPK